jgi:hypothetical protein
MSPLSVLCLKGLYVPHAFSSELIFLYVYRWMNGSL